MTSPHAAVAKAIRAELKQRGIKGSVTSKTYSGGNSVRVDLIDAPCALVKELERLFSKYEYGTFDGMTDCYNVDNRRDDIPQVKFLFVNNELSDAKRQEVWEKCRTFWYGGDKLPISYEAACNMQLQGQYVSQMVWQQWNKETENQAA